MATYAVADRETVEMLERVVRDYHPHFAEHGITFKILLAYAPKDERTGQPRGAAIRGPAGGRLDARADPYSLENRVAGLPDAKIKLDGDRFKEWTARQVEARLSHAVSQLEIRSDEEGYAETDDCGRPKLKRSEASVIVLAYRGVMQAFGDDAPEAEAIREAALLMEELAPARPTASGAA
jgi:hypothetical protein